MPLIDLPDIMNNVDSKTVINYQDDQYLTIRQRAIKEAAQELGIKSGLAWASEVMNKRLDNSSSYLDQIYNFNAVVLESNVLPPVIKFADESLNLDNSQEKLSLTGARYEIAQKARFYTTLPSWRDYLMLHYTMPEWPNKVLLPENAEERELWQKILLDALSTGIQQAEEIYVINVGRLTLEYRGMVLYHQLLAYHMVTPIHVKKVDKGVTAQGNQMVIDDRQWYVDMQTTFNLELDRWQPFVVDAHKPALKKS